jgi:hypothetical protein
MSFVLMATLCNLTSRSTLDPSPMVNAAASTSQMLGKGGNMRAERVQTRDTRQFMGYKKPLYA